MSTSTGANAIINICVDSDVKNKAQDLFATLGTDMTTAVNIFLRQAIRKNSIPFDLVTEKPQRKNRQFGRMKGKMWMADDWDVPLDDIVRNTSHPNLSN